MVAKIFFSMIINSCRNRNPARHRIPYRVDCHSKWCHRDQAAPNALDRSWSSWRTSIWMFWYYHRTGMPEPRLVQSRALLQSGRNHRKQFHISARFNLPPRFYNVEVFWVHLSIAIKRNMRFIEARYWIYNYIATFPSRIKHPASRSNQIIPPRTL